MRRLAIALVLLAATRLSFTQNADFAKVKGTSEAIIVANNVGDLNAVAQLYADDAVWLPPTSPLLEGKASILARYQASFQHFTMKLRLDSVETQVFGDWAFDHGFTRGKRLPKSGRASTAVNDKYLMILHRAKDGTWKIARLMWNPV